MDMKPKAKDVIASDPYSSIVYLFDSFIFFFAEDCLNVMKQELMVMGRDGRPVQRARRRFSVRESNKQIRS